MSDDESVQSSLSYQFTSLPPKTATQINDEFGKLVEASYGVGSKKYKKFISLVECYKAHRVAKNNFRCSIRLLFHDDMNVYVNFCKNVLPSLTPEISDNKEQVFLSGAKLAFMENRRENSNSKSYVAVEALMQLFRDGDISLEHLTLEMRKLLKGEVEVMEYFHYFLPDSKDVSEQRDSIASSGLVLLLASSALVLILAFIISARFLYDTK